MKFKIGDTVRIKDLTKCEDKNPGIIEEMLKYSGEITKIKLFTGEEENWLILENNQWSYHEDWLELVLKDKIKNILNR